MIGLGVGIDYALLIVTRYREQLHAGHTVRESVTTAIDTAGRSVVFAGCTVVISLRSMMLIGVTFVQSLAITASAVVAVTILASVTLLPALLGFAGRRVEPTRCRGLVAAGLVAVGMFGLGLKIVPLAAAGFLLALVVLAAGLFAGPPSPSRRSSPTAGAGSSSAGRGSSPSWPPLSSWSSPCRCWRCASASPTRATPPTTPTTKKAYDLIVDGFGPGYSGPLLLADGLLPAGVSARSQHRPPDSGRP
jgi:putative drug exporter of the RND superfamily